MERRCRKEGRTGCQDRGEKRRWGYKEREAERRETNGGEEWNVPGAWMRGEERKNESTKGRERRIEGWWRPRPGRYDHYHQHHHRHLYHDEHDAGQSAELGSYANACTDTRWDLSVFFFLTLRASLSLSLFRSLPRSPYSSPDIFSPLALSTIRHFERERLPSMGRFPHDDFGTYLVSFLR